MMSLNIEINLLNAVIDKLATSISFSGSMGQLMQLQEDYKDALFLYGYLHRN